MNARNRFALLIVVALVAACGGDAVATPVFDPPITEPPIALPTATRTAVAVVPTPTQPQAVTPPPTATVTEAPVPTPTYTATPIATATPTPSPTATPIVRPTGTPVPSQTPTPTPTASAEPTPTPSADPSAAPGMVLLGRWTTKFRPGPSNGNGANIRVPAQVIDGTIVKPGELFQFVDAIQPVTKARGYAEGSYLRNGQIQTDPGILGGGMCSASTTLFNAAMRAGLRVVERHPHAIYISRYPVGLDATVFSTGHSDGQDVKFVNDTGRNVLIRGYGGRKKVTFEIYGIDDGRTVDLSKPVVEDVREAIDWLEYSDDLAPGERLRSQDRYDGFRSFVTRTVRDRNGNLIWKDTFSSKYRLLDGIIKIGRYKGDPPAGTRIRADDYPGPPSKPKPSDPPPSDPPPSDPPPSDPPPSDDPSPEPTPEG